MAKLPVNAHQLTFAQSEVIDIYTHLEQEIFLAIAKRLNGGNLKVDDVLRWQIEKMRELHLLNKDVVKLLADATGQSEVALTKLFVDDGMNTYDSELNTLKQAKIKPKTNNKIDAVLKGYRDQTFLEIGNLVNQTLISTNYKKGLVADAYQQIIKETTADVISGLKTLDRSMADTIYKWRDNGIGTVLTDKGGHKWSLEGYVRTVIKTTSNRAFQSVRDKVAEDNGIDTFVMSSHPASREACAPIQGKLITTHERSFRHSKSGEFFESIYSHGYGTPAGCFGINCSHIKWLYIPGVSTNNQPQYDPEEAIANGKLQQKQRALERNVRAEKRKLELAQELGDEEGMLKYSLGVKKYQRGLRYLVDNHDTLVRQYGREKIIRTKQRS